MSVSLSLALFFVIWWTTLFAILPLGLRTQADEGDVVPGTPPSAPAAPRLVRLFLINTGVAMVVFAIVWFTVAYRLIDLERLPMPRM
jgi:predicted secreted protein